MKHPRFVFITLLLLLLSTLTFSQTPSHFPNPVPEPVDFFEDTASIILYIIIPIAIAILYFVWKRNLARQQKEQENQDV